MAGRDWLRGRCVGALAGLVMDGDASRHVNGLPDGRLFLIPTTDITISPTWQDAAAMRGTLRR